MTPRDQEIDEQNARERHINPFSTFFMGSYIWNPQDYSVSRLLPLLAYIGVDANDGLSHSCFP